MAFSKEMRTPFLNKDLFTLCENARHSSLNISSKQLLIDYINVTLGRNLCLVKRGFNSGGMKEGFEFLEDSSEYAVSRLILQEIHKVNNMR